jgi:hypothetical protein
VGTSGPGITYRSVRANPGDIVEVAWGEEGRDTVATAKLIREGAILRAKLEAEIRKRAEGDPATCASRPGSKPLGGAVVKGGQGDAVIGVRGEVLTLIAPVVPGEELVADLFWSDRTQRLVIRWPAGDIVFDAFFERRQPPASPAPRASSADEVCACHREVNGAASCEQFLSDESAACAATYKGRCKEMIACSLGDPLAMPACPKGEVNAGSLGRCRPLCSGEAPCKAGACQTYGGGGVCTSL